MSDLQEFLLKLAEHFDEIPVRAQVDGTWGTFFLDELTDEQARDVVINWIREKRK